MRNPGLIRAFRGDDETWHGSPRRGVRHLLPFYPSDGDPAAVSPFAGKLLVVDIGETTTPPGWTRFHLGPGTFYATDIVCWLLFGADAPDCWPSTRRCGAGC